MSEEDRPFAERRSPPSAILLPRTALATELTDATGVVVRDMYCLACGYNLRGLSGAAIRCPECGESNPIEIAGIPAPFIKEAMKRMESAPTACVAFALLICLCIGLGIYAGLANARGYFCASAILVPLVFGWFAAYQSTQEIYQNKPGWRTVVRDFHIAAVLCLPIIPSPFGLLAAIAFGDRHAQPLWITAAALSVPLLILGLRLYRKTQVRIAVMQRDAAVRIAAERLRSRYGHGNP